MDLRRFKCINASSQAFLPGFLPFDTLLQMQNAKGRLRLYPGSYDADFYFFCPGLFQHFNQSLYVLSTAFIIASKKKNLNWLRNSCWLALGNMHRKSLRQSAFFWKVRLLTSPLYWLDISDQISILHPYTTIQQEIKVRLLIKRSYFLFHIF